MSTHEKEKIERILKILDRLAIQSAKGLLIIVEGDNDIDVLRKMAISGEIIAAKKKSSFLALINEIENRDMEEVILLLDFDKSGEEWTKKLTRHLEQTNVKPNNFFWRKLRNLMSHDVKDIEGMFHYLQTLKKKSGNS